VKFQWAAEIAFSFLFSGAAGICLIFCVYSNNIISFLYFCFGLIPLFWFSFWGKKKALFFAFLGFSLPVSFLVGEGIWHSLRYYYQVPFLPSVVIFLGWVLLAGCLQWLIFLFFSRKWLSLKPDSFWLLPFVWMAIEFIYGKFSIQGSSFDLGLLGPLNSFSKNLARAGGVHAISFFYVCINTFVLTLIRQEYRSRTLKKGWIISFGFLAALYLAGSLIKEETELKRPFHAALLQPNLTILRQEKVDQTTQQRLEKLIEMTRSVLKKEPDLIVWPAAVLSIRDNTEVSNAIKRIGDKAASRTKLLLGVVRTVLERSEERQQNTIYYVNTRGDIEDVYVKHKLTPYTEYVPFSIFDFIGRRQQGIRAYLNSVETGDVFTADGIKWGSPICVEIYYPGYLREYSKSGADFFIHFSNDDAFGQTHFKKLLVKLSALRAVELGVPILRLSITGISAHIDFEGQIIDSLPSGKEDIVYATLIRKLRTTFYAWFGDLFSYVSILVTIWGLCHFYRGKK